MERSGIQARDERMGSERGTLIRVIYLISLSNHQMSTSERTPLLRKVSTSGEAGFKDFSNAEPSIIGMSAVIVGRLAHHRFLRGLKLPQNMTGDGDNQAYYDEALQSSSGDALDRALNAFLNHRKPVALEPSPRTFTTPLRDSLVIAALLYLTLEAVPPPQIPEISVTEALRNDTLAIQSREVYCSAVLVILDAAAAIMPIREDLDSPGKDAIVEMLFTSLPLGYEDPRMGSEVSIMDLILRLPKVPRTDTLKAIIIHPAISSACEMMWRQPLFGELTPQCLYLIHSSAYFIYAFLAVFLALTPETAHYYHFNPLRQYYSRETFIGVMLWYPWLVASFGYLLEVIRCLARGPLPYRSSRRLPLPPGALMPLLAHSLVSAFLILRILSRGKFIVVSIAYPLLAWSIPLFLFSIFVFPIGLQSLNPYRVRFDEDRFKTLRVLNERLAAFSPLVPFLGITLFALFWAVNGDVERYDPKSSLSFSSIIPSIGSIVSPIEARTSLAFGLLFILVLGWLMGDAHFDANKRAVEIEVAARLERIRTVRFFSPRDDEDIPVTPIEELIHFFVDTLPCWILSKIRQDWAIRAAENWHLRFQILKKKSVEYRAFPWLAKRWL